MKRLFLTFGILSISLAVFCETPPTGSYNYIDAGVQILSETQQTIERDTIITIRQDTMVTYEHINTINSIAPMLVRHTNQEQRLFGIKEYSYGNQQMDEKELELFFRKNNRDVYLKYMRSKEYKTAGWWLLGSGLTLTFIGGMCFLAPDYYYEYCTTKHNERHYHLEYGEYVECSGRFYYYDGYHDEYYYDECDYETNHYHRYEYGYAGSPGEKAGFTIWPIGVAAVTASVTLLCIAYTKYNFVELYNNQNAHSRISLGITTNLNGVGLALTF